MSLIDRYIFREWFVTFLLTIGAILGILVLQNMYDSLPDLLEADATPKQIVYYYALAFPTYLPAILPIALLVSLLFSIGTLHRNNEITAIRTSGTSLFRLSRSLWVAGLVISVCLVYLASAVIPQSVEAARTFFDNLAYDAEAEDPRDQTAALVYNLGFDNRQDGRLWFMNRFSEVAWLGLGINVHTRDEEGRETNRISAREAYYDDINQYWVFKDGRELQIDAETGDPLRNLSFEEKTYEDFDEDPSLMLALHKKPKELSLFELRRIKNTLRSEDNPQAKAYEVRYYSLLAAPFSCLVVIGIAVPFAASGVRTNPIIGVSKAVGFFLIFYLLVNVANVLGDRGVISPVVAAWIPNVTMLLTSIYLFRKVR